MQRSAVFLVSAFAAAVGLTSPMLAQSARPPAASTTSTSLPRIRPVPSNIPLRIAQTRQAVATETEMIHEARVVPLDARPHLPTAIRPWLGDSRAHWEGDTLVVETTTFNERTPYRGSDANL